MPPPPEDPRERFWRWAEGDFVNSPTGIGSLANLIQHLQTFWDRRDDPQVVLFHYHDLLTDLPGRPDQRLAELTRPDLIEWHRPAAERDPRAGTRPATRGSAPQAHPSGGAQVTRRL